MTKLNQRTFFWVVSAMLVHLDFAAGAEFQHRDIIYETYYTNSDFSKLVDAVFDGMSWASYYSNAEACRESVGQLMDDFHFMYNNHTAQGLGMAERVFNVTGVVAGPFARTFFQCFITIQQAQRDIVDRMDSFLNLNDLLTSALFNALAQSIEIREQGLKLITLSNEENYVEWTRSFCVIIKSLIYFESSSAALDPNRDPNSPYLRSATGELEIKGEAPDLIQQRKGPARDLSTKRAPCYRELGSKRKPPMARQQEEELDPMAEYFNNISALQFFNFWFGLVDGALNAFPAGGFLYYCGQFSEAQRNATLRMYESYVERDFNASVYSGYVALAQTHQLSRYCYYGFLDLLSGSEAFYSNYNFLDNVSFNFGFMWTDVIMILTGLPGHTTQDYFYYLAFYVGDFFLRFVFRESSEGLCWLPWNGCEDIVKSTVVLVTDPNSSTSDETA